MITKIRASQIAMLIVLVVAVSNSGCGGGSATMSPSSVAVSPSTGMVVENKSVTFTATVLNDPTNKGVTWGLGGGILLGGKLTCGNDPGVCGFLSNPTATSVTYNAPSMPLPTAAAVSATSVADPSKSALVELKVVPPVSITTALLPDGTVGTAYEQQVQATGGIPPYTWSIASGSLPSWATLNSSTGTISGIPGATGTADFTIQVADSETPAATSAQTLSIPVPAGTTANDSELSGHYAFLFNGFDGTTGTQVAVAGSFTADGTGKITGGEADILGSGGAGADVSINPSGSTYAVGPDHRGCVVLVKANGTTLSFRFALGSVNSSSGIATSGHIIEFDDATGSGKRGAGSIRLQDATSFTASEFKGNYAFGLHGAMAGTFNSDGISAITSNTIDSDFAGAVTSNMTSTPGGNFTCCSANGRGTVELDNGSLGLRTFVMYMINSHDVFLVFQSCFACNFYGIVDGEAIGIPSETTFSQASLSGVSVIRESAQSSAGPIVDIATASADGKGAITLNDNVNNAGTFTTSSTALNYDVASNGRVTVSGGSTPMVLYLHGQNQGFLVGTDPDVTFGVLEPQAVGPFNNASFSGAYTFGTENPSANTVTMESGVVTADGKGNATGTSDQSSPTGLAQNQALNFRYSFSATGIGNAGSNTTAILISGNKLVFINNTSTNPTITVVEK